MSYGVKYLSEIFSAYNRKSVISLLAALFVQPENHSQVTRLKVALQAAITSTGQKGDAPHIQWRQLEKILLQTFTNDHPAWREEDPQEALFTDLICTHGGNYIVFPEILEDSYVALNNLIDTIFMTKNNLPRQFKEEVFFAVRTLLQVSNVIASKMGYSRYMTSPHRHREDVFFPATNWIQKSESAITFQYKAILTPDGRHELYRKEVIDFFICESTMVYHDGDDFNCAPIQTKPFYLDGDDLLVTRVNGIPAALVHFIVCKILSYKIYDAFLVEYRQVIASRSFEYLRRAGYEALGDLPTISKSHPLYDLEEIFRIDNDKLAYVTLIPDLFQGYDIDMHMTRHNEFINKDVILRRREVVNNFAQNRYGEVQLLFINLYIPIGREYRIEIPHDRVLLVNLSFADLICLYQHPDHAGPLSLYRMRLAEQAHLEHASMVVFSLLDKFAFFMAHRESFYFTDEGRFPTFYIEVGFANTFRQEAHIQNDMHLEQLHENGMIQVVRWHPSNKVDIYAAIEYFPRMVVTNLPIPLWVHPVIQKGSDPSIKHVCSALMEACAYWIWETGGRLRQKLSGLPITSLSLEIILQEPDGWINHTFEGSLSPEEVSALFDVKIHGSKVLLYIPLQFAALFGLRNNVKDQVLVNWILKGINLILEDHHQVQLNIADILKTYVPPGDKTMIHGVDSGNFPMVHDHVLPPRTLVSDFEVEQLLNDLAIKAVFEQPVGDITDPKEKGKACNRIVGYHFSELKKIVAQFDFDELLLHLMAVNESLWCSKHLAGEKMLARLACFAHVPEMRADIMDEAIETEEATIACRCLIELLLAIPAQGHKMINRKDTEYMLSLSKEIVTWGTLSDEISYGINDMEFGILPSGRIGTGKEFLNNAVRPYSMAKRNEDIDERILESSLKFQGTVKPKQRSKEPEQVKEIAYQAEFGASFTAIGDVLIELAFLGIETEDAIMVWDQAELVSILIERTGLVSEEISIILNNFSLTTRADWNTVLLPFVKQDTYPWRYNRQLSLLRRPIIRLEKAGKTVFYVGLRQVMIAYQYLDDQVTSGRLKTVSPEMNRYIGQILNLKGKEFTQRCYNWLNEHFDRERFIFDREVKIDVKGRLVSSSNLGDIDILIIDMQRKKIISVECKHVTPARITSEFATELRKFESDWISKHLRRHKWLTSNRDQLGKLYNLKEIDTYEIKSVFLTSEKIPYPFIRKTYKNLIFYDFSSWLKDQTIIKRL